MRSKKIIGIFTYKQRLLSMDMKTKLVQHVSRIISNRLTLSKFSSFQVFRFSSFQVFRFPAPVWLSDIFYTPSMRICLLHILTITRRNKKKCQMVYHRTGDTNSFYLSTTPTKDDEVRFPNKPGVWKPHYSHRTSITLQRCRVILTKMLVLNTYIEQSS